METKIGVLIRGHFFDESARVDAADYAVADVRAADGGVGGLRTCQKCGRRRHVFVAASSEAWKASIVRAE